MSYRKTHLLCALTLLTAVACGDDGAPLDVDATPEFDAPGDVWDYDLEEAFVRMDPTATSGSGHTVDTECDPAGEGWTDAAATIAVRQDATRTFVDVTLTDGRPDTLYTFWLRLRGTDPVTGETYGGSPITDGGSTPLAPSTDLGALVEAMNGPGEPTAINGFISDATGAGSFSIELDFPMIGGAYPFSRYDAQYADTNTVGAPDAPFLVRMASHCQDGLSHGLSPANREAWFNWSPTN